MEKSKLTNCKACGAQVAKTAKTCPHCGAKVKKGHPVLIGVLVVIILFAVIGAVGSSNERHTHETSDEVIHIIEGTFRFVFPTGDVVLKEKDCIYIPRGLEHQIFNIGTKPAFHSYTFTDTQSTDLIIKKYNK